MINFLLLSLLCVSSLFANQKTDLATIFSTIYIDKNGNLMQPFQVPQEEKDAATKIGCSAIYGEPPADGVEAMMKRFNELLDTTKPTGKRKFMDAGSGSGRMVFGACIVGGFTECYGVELCKTRHSIATQALANLKKQYPHSIPKGARIKFTNKDARKANFRGLHALWISNLCFPKEVTEVLMKKADAEMRSHYALCRLPVPVQTPEAHQHRDIQNVMDRSFNHQYLYRQR